MNKKPYRGTKVGWMRTQGQIQAMLEKFGVENIRWTSGKRESVFIVRFEFIYENKEGGRIPLRIEVPIPDENERSSLMRMLFWFLKSKLEAVEAGFREFQEEFLSYIVDPTKDLTIYQLAQKSITEMAMGLGASSFLKALPKYEDG